MFVLVHGPVPPNAVHSLMIMNNTERYTFL